MREKIIITVDGTALTDEIDDLMEVIVDTNLHLPNMFTIVIPDEADPKTGKLKFIDNDQPFKLGAEVKIEIETEDIPGEANAVKGTLIIGEITALEPAYTSNGREILQIRGYDRSHRLTRGKKTRTYGDGKANSISETQIIDTVVQETAGVTGKKVDSKLGQKKYPYVMQMNQTDLEFLWSRAERLGYQVYVEDKTLFFQPADAHRGKAGEQPAKLTWPDNLLSFHPRLILSNQVNQAVVTSWDPDTKKTIESKITSHSSKSVSKIGYAKNGGASAKQAFTDAADEVLVTEPGLTIDHAKAIAEAKLVARESEFVQAEGVCRDGDPRLIAGRIVTVEGVGKRFSGDYYVTEARHMYGRGQYRITFGVMGRAAYTASHLLKSKNGTSNSDIHGVVVAKVTSLEDPENLGRIQVMFPWLPKYKGSDLASAWARVASPMAGKERGFYFLPEVDDEVLVAFEHGDANAPYIVGGLWNKIDKPPEGTASVLDSGKKKVNQRVIRSRTGHLIILDDTKDKEQIIIQDKTKKNKFVIDSKKNSMTINVEKDLEIKAKGKINIEATGDLTIKGKNSTFEGTAKGDIKAPQVAVNGSSKVDVKGAQVSIN